jgi:hypothetical protein
MMARLDGFAPYLLLWVFGIAAFALLCCALAGYVEAWRVAGEHEHMPKSVSWLASDWFLYMNALVCFAAMLGIIAFY